MAPTPENFSVQGTQGNLDAQKRALLSALAQGGSALAQQVGAAQAGQVSAGQQAAAAAASRSVNPEQAAQASAAAGGMGARFAGISQQQGQVAQSFMSNLGASSERYMNEVGAAVPLVQEQTQQQLNSLQSAAGQAEQERALRLQLAQMQLAKAQAGDSVDPLDQEYKRLRNAGLQKDLDGGPDSLSPQDRMAELQLQDELDSRGRSQARDELISREGPQAANAARLALAGASNQAEALANLDKVYTSGQAKTPKGKDLDRKYMTTLLSRIYNVQPPRTGGSLTPFTG